MSELTKLETLKKAVVDTKAAYVDAWAAAAYAAYDVAFIDEGIAARDAWDKAKLELARYLKEQDNG